MFTALPTDTFGLLSRPLLAPSIQPSIHPSIYLSCLPSFSHFPLEKGADYLSSFSSTLCPHPPPSPSSSSHLSCSFFLLSPLPEFLSSFSTLLHFSLFFPHICMAAFPAFSFCCLPVCSCVCVCLYVWATHTHTHTHAGTHRSVRLCCPTAIHHHFICLNWMPSGPLILPIFPLTNSCSLHTLKNNTQTHTQSQTRFSPPAPLSTFFPSLTGEGVRERRWWSGRAVYQTEGNGVRPALILSVLSFLPSRE